MNEREIVRKLLAFKDGRALPSGETIHFHVADDNNLLIVAFVRMGGESRPWGIAYGKPGEEPEILAVPEARNLDLVGRMVATFSPTLLKHLHAPGHCSTDLGGPNDTTPLRQVWVPNPTHLDMIHYLAFAYTYTRSGGDNTELLKSCGRACSWLFRESQRPGTQLVRVATGALRDAYTFPTETVRQGHLGFLLAWLNAGTSGTAVEEMAAEAERLPIATSLDPSVENDQLSPEVAAWGDADKAGKSRVAKRHERAIASILTDELKRRWDLTEEAIEKLRADTRRPNALIESLINETRSEQWKQYVRFELQEADPEDGPAFHPSVETDHHPAAAASRFFVHDASAEFLATLLLHDDAELLSEAIADGDAIKGEIVDVVDEAAGTRKTRPVWTIRDTSRRELRIRVGTELALAGFKNRTGRLRSITEDPDGSLLIKFAILNLVKAKPQFSAPHDRPPVDQQMIGHEVALVRTSMDGISRRKAGRVWSAEGPGAWLTHGRAGGVNALVADGDNDEFDEVVEGIQEMNA